MRRDEDIIVSGHDETEQDADHADMREDEAGNHQWVVAQRVELGIREAEDDGEHGRAEIPDQQDPESRNVPIVARADNDVQIASQLIALFNDSIAPVSKTDQVNDRYPKANAKGKDRCSRCTQKQNKA